MNPVWPRWMWVVVASLLGVGAGLGLGIGVAHWRLPPAQPLLSPSYTQPRDRGAAARRAVALVIGETRASDGMTFDTWYRARLNKFAPGIEFEYQAELSGNDDCGYWSVYATVIPGPAHGPANTVDVLNQYGAVGTVNEVTGSVAGLDKQSAGVGIYQGACLLQPRPAEQTWLDAFRAGAAP